MSTPNKTGGWLGSFTNWGNTTSEAETDTRETKKLAEEVDSQLSGGNWLGVSRGLETMGAVVKTIFTNSEHRRHFFEDFAKGAKQGFFSQGSEKGEESLIRSIFEGLKEMSGAAFGRVTGIALQKLLENAQSYSLDEEDANLIKESREELEEASKTSKGTYSDKTDAEKVQSLQDFLKRVRSHQLTENETALLAKFDKEFIDPIDSTSKKIKDPSLFYRSAKTLQRICARLRTGETNLSIDSLEKELTEFVKSVRSIYFVAQNIRKQLNKYHVIVGGLDVSILLKWNGAEEGEEGGIVSPISSLVDCQAQIGKLKESFALKAPEEPSSRISEEKEKTDKLLNDYCKKLAEMSTMQAVDYCLGKQRTDEFYRKILHDGTGRVRSEYAKTFSGIGKYLVHLPFMIVYKLINPLVAKTFSKLVEDIRLFLSNDLDLLKFSEEKIKDLTEYFGRIDLAREKYLDTGTRTDEAGTFDKFCEQTIKLYEGKFSEASLLTIFKKYIVDRYVPRPNLSIKGFRIPLLTTFFEWMVWSIRKSMIRSYLKRSQLVETYLKDGTGSVALAQLGVKRVLENKLKQFKDAMEKNLARRLQPIDTSSNGRKTVAEETAKAEALREKWISSGFHNTIEEFSGGLVRFVDIEGCRGDKPRLRRLDNKVDTLFQEIKEVLHPFLPLDSFSTNDTLKNTCTTVTENALLTFFSTKDSQAESHLQDTFELLGRSFTYFDQVDDRLRAHQKHQEELRTVDSNLRTLLHEISEIAVKDAVNDRLENVSGERHQRTEQFVKHEQEVAESWLTVLRSKKENISQQLEMTQTGEAHFQAIQTPVAQFVDSVGRHLSHLSSMLHSKSMTESYTDVQQSLYQTNQRVLTTINTRMIASVQQLASGNQSVYEIDLLNQACDAFIAACNSIGSTITDKQETLFQELKKSIHQLPHQELPAVEATQPFQDLFSKLQKQKGNHPDKEVSEKRAEQIKATETEIQKLAIQHLKTSLPTLSTQDFSEQVRALETLPSEIKELSEKLKIFEEKETKTKEKAQCDLTSQQIKVIEGELAQLSISFRELSDVRINNMYDTQSKVDTQKASLKSKIFAKIEELKTTYTKQNTTDALYQLIGSFLDVQSAEALNEALVSALSKHLKQGGLFSSNSLFTEFKKLKSQSLTSSTALTKTLASLESKLTGLDVESLRKSLKEKEDSLHNAKEQIQRKLEQTKEGNLTKREQTQEAMKQTLVDIEEQMTAIGAEIIKPRVKGYITVGQLQLRQTLSPKIVAGLVPHIHGKMETVVTSLGKPFHWKQLVLRLMITGIAKQQDSAA